MPPLNGRKSTRNKLRPREEWIEIPVPAILSEEVFEAAQRVSRDHTYFSPRRSPPGRWLLRQLVVCGRCGVKTYCQDSKGRHGRSLRYDVCNRRRSLEAGGPTARARSPQPAPRRWKRWCGTSSATRCSTRKPYGKGRRCSASAGASRMMSC